MGLGQGKWNGELWGGGGFSWAGKDLAKGAREVD